MSIPGKDGDGDGGITILIEIMAAILCPFRYLWARAVISTLIVSLMTELNETVILSTLNKKVKVCVVARSESQVADWSVRFIRMMLIILTSILRTA